MLRSRILFAPLSVVLAAQALLVPIQFEEIADKAGVRFTTRNSATPEKQQPEAMVAGVAIFDYDNDGDVDIYFVNGADMPSLIKTLPEHSNRLFRNNGNLTFTDVTVEAGVTGAGYGMGASAADFDNDGDTDLFLPSLTANQLYRNNGDGTFTDISAAAGLQGAAHNGRKMWSVAAAWLDYDNDGLLDVFVSNYCAWDPATAPDCRVNGQRVYCNPRHFKPLPNSLYRNLGNGKFRDVSTETGISKHLGRGMGVAIADYDNDGFQDVYVANDDSPSQLFHNVRGKRFDEVGHDLGVALPEQGNVISGMGVDFRDISNKGSPAVWVTAVENETFPLYTMLAGTAQFIDSTSAAGLTLETARMSGWSNAILDLDNDGWKDLFVARSNVLDNIALFSRRQHEEPNAVFQNQGASSPTPRFRNVTAVGGDAIQQPAVHRGAAFGDLDNDGRLDLVVSVLNGPAKILRNTTATDNKSALLALTGSRSNRSAIGAKVTITLPDGSTQHNHVTSSTGYASSSDLRVHFGLGSAAAPARIDILWPSGTRQTIHDVPTTRIIAITEPVTGQPGSHKRPLRSAPTPRRPERPDGKLKSRI